MPAPPLPTPAVWLRDVLGPQLGLAAPAGAHPDWLRLVDLDAVRLAGVHAHLVAGGATGPAAAKWLASWVPGGPASAVGRALALTGAALVLDPARVRWHLCDGGWPDGLDLGDPAVVVAPGHPWAGQLGVEVAPGHAEVRTAARDGVVAVSAPLVGRLRTLAKAGLPSLWAEVADRLGLAVTADHGLPVDERAAEELRAVVALPGSPWRARPTVGVAPTAAGPAYVGQKGGCCLAFQCAQADPEDGAGEPDPTGWLAVYRARYPAPRGRPDYCLTCPLLQPDDAAARQRLYVEHVRS